ncbi:hypothetical protein A3D00_05045 [Candidatus Woesebacteria bacterium RIFCSPHIGHO2_02_FULL_38_9]|uniref:Glycosyl transferase family 1 domain-containing protein n=1 Tax=Candidatus Woesebacteria bacterium RIFCSPHIGHO2_01_FULL_39_28 TaxID=1802496 RepID=A0A1F7YC66_9BACT|nr:MAG: hypothetical protein A2627_02890 [Candidatus Woesebacteria bacterium RIFCSPHIGHO2_01_FULL_39_28]OGM32354.1 MAG: hypothetical protein A3D00_05045 [Candidatus Woesebacteria bacterium RIFCSPHIGHO2_02_FULL_38_9]OGM57995.1 MAG: hypothetical protein A3A50_01900 [Candidatus Woesebacteria bacterium RIFCSPLOWO2_01_FULL_38_20]
MKKIIGIDGNEANIERRVGVNQYAYELLKSIHRLQDEWKNKYRIVVYLKSIPLADMPKETENFEYKVLSGRGLWIITKLMPNLFFDSPKPDIFFTPSHYLPPFAPIPMVCSIMDLGYLKFSEHFKKYDFWQLKFWTARSISISKNIITISGSTAKDIVRHYPFSSNKIVTVPLGYDKERFNCNISPHDVRRVKKRYGINKNYILFLSTLKPSKNIEGLLEAFSLIYNLQFTIYNDIELVIAGKKGWLYDSIFQKAKDLKLTKRVIFTDFVPEEDKPALIKGARVFVLPSFWEGFGIDVLSAMACGVPVVVSNVASLPEVVGDDGMLIDPSKPASIATAIKKILSMDKNEYNKFVEAGLVQTAKFSWEKTAQKTLEVLGSAI